MTLESRTLEFGLGSGLIADEPRQIATEGTYNLVPDLINEAPAPKMGGSAIRPGDANLLIVIAVLALLAWFADICRRILQLYELSVAVTSGGIVRLEDGRSLAELQMLWGMNMNMRQQLLRARRVSAGVAVSQIQVPLIIKDILCSAHAGADGRRTLRICFDYTGTVACSAQLFWGMEQGAVQRLVRRLNFPASDRRRGRPAGRSLLTLLRQKTPSFRNRYTAVENRETVEGKGEGFLLEASVGFFSEGSRGALFPDHECAGISEPFAVPAGRDRVEKELNLTTRERVGLASNDSVRSGQEAGAQLLILSEGGGNEAGSAIRDSAGMITQSETSAHGNSGEVSLFPLVIAVSFEEGAAGLTARPNHGALGNSAASDLEAVDREEVRQLLYVVSAGPAASLLSHLRQTVVVTSKVTYVTQDIYGEDEHEETECIMYVLQCMPLQLFFFLVCILSCQWTLVPLADLLTGYQLYSIWDAENAVQNQCRLSRDKVHAPRHVTSCLTDPKEITLLPCRHHCVCAKCMSRLEQCPVCRTPFMGYLRAPPQQPPRCSAEAAELGGQISGGDVGGATDSAEGEGARVGGDGAGARGSEV